MLTRAIIGRTFKIQFGTGQGTCFSVEVENRQYLITAKHVVPGIKPTDQVRIFQENRWKTLNTTIAWIPEDDRDIAVLNPGGVFCPPIPLAIMSPGDMVDVPDVRGVLRFDSAGRPGQAEQTQEKPGTLRGFKENAERAFLVEKLREHNWNISKTAEVIDTPRSNLYKKLEQYGIKQEVDG